MQMEGEISNIPIVFQSVMIGLMLFFLFVALQQKMTDTYKWLVFAGFAGLIQNVGYLTILLSKEVSEARAALTIEYCGIAFVTSFSMFFVISFFEKKVSIWVKRAIIIENTIVLLSVVYMNYVDIFYKEIYVNRVDGIVKITSDKGFLFNLHLIVNFAEMITCFVIPITSLLKAKTKQQILRGWLTLLATIFPVLSYVVLLLGVVKGFDTVPCSVVFAAFVFFIANVKAGIFDGQNAANLGIVETLRDPVITVDARLYYVSSNQSAKELLPQVREWKTGDCLEEKYLFSEVMEETLKNGDVCEIEMNGRFFSVSVNQVFDRKRLLGYTIFFKDMTKERIQVEKMEKLKNDAVLASQAKSDFLSNMSHEIRTPINAIMGMNEMILRVTEEDETKKYATNIHTASSTLLSLINNILDLSKIEAGKIEILEEDYSLGRVMKECYDLVLQKAVDKDLYFRIEAEETLPCMLRGDAFHLRQVLINLLTNAMKYTPSGGVKLTVSGEKTPDQVEQLVFKIKDTGIGIKEESISHLFDAFQRVDIKKNIHIEGTGLGLAISKRLIELLNGSIQVESVYGQGSVFTVCVPQRIVDASMLGDFMKNYVEKQENHQVEKTKFTAEAANILVVDDMDMNLLVVKGLLKETKAQIDTAKSGLVCLENTLVKKYDLIFMDHMMPGMDGIEAFQEVRKQEGGKNLDTPVVILTANALSGMKEEYLSKGFDGYLSKPVTGESLEQALLTYLPASCINM